MAELLMESSTIEESPKDYERLKAFVVSDVHLNNHPYDQSREIENPRRRNFRIFLTRINNEILPTDKVQLILNGDILDITGSWLESVMPWDGDRQKVQETLNRLLLDIMENNLSTFQEIRKLLQHPHSELIYVFGNHDGLLQRYPESHDIIRTFLSPHQAVQKRIHFAPFFESEELDLYIEHGHMLDPFNHADSHQPPLGDVINILIVNRFVDLAIERLRTNGYSEDFIIRMHAQLHDIEYLRPLALVPVWIQTVGHQYGRDPERMGKRSVQDILMEVVSEILYNPVMIEFMIQRLHMPRALLHLLIKTTLRIPAILPMISFFTSKLVRRTHSNKYQYKAAQRIYREKGRRLVAFGHTHIPGVQPLSENAYYFNTGSWKPVINLFKYSKEDLVELEYLSPEVHFNKVERCGILRLEKSDLSGNTPAEFSLQTIQSGLS